MGEEWKMAEESTENNEPKTVNKYQIGPGLGLLLMGIMYLVFWLMPFTLEAYAEDPRWSHNWAYALIIITIGASFYQETVASRVVALIQSLLMPLTASGAFNTKVMTLSALAILSIWIIVVMLERKRNEPLLDNKLSRRNQNWVTMHSLILAWILMAHMGLVFFIGRLPFEAQLDTIGTSLGRAIGFLVNLPVERFDLVTYVFDINLILLSILFIYEQFKLGYNPQEKPWPKISFWFLWVTIALGFLLLPVNLRGVIP